MIITAVATLAWISSLQSNQKKAPVRPTKALTRVVVPGADNAALIGIKVLSNAGGLPKTTTETDLAKNYTTGLVKAIESAAQHRVQIISAPNSTAGFVLEGSLSRTENSVNGGAYLCVLKLSKKVGESDIIIGQWAGYAENLRYLSGNLNGFPGVSNQGLLGELSICVINEVNRYRAHVDGVPYSLIQTAADSGLDAFIVLPTQANPSQPNKKVVLKPNQPFAVSVKSTTDGSIFAVTKDSLGQFVCRSLTASDQPCIVKAGKPITLPTAETWTSDSTSGDKVLYVLLRKNTPIKTAKAVLSEGQSRENPPEKSVNSPDLPVRVISVVNNSRLESVYKADKQVEELLAMIAQDPKQSWIVKAIKYTVSADTPEK